MTFDHFCREIDLKWRIPRPANAQHLSAVKAFILIGENLGRAGSFILCGVVTGVAWVGIVVWIEIGIKWTLISIIAAVTVAVLFSLLAFDDLFRLYDPIFQRETFGKARWASIPHLEEKGFARNRCRLRNPTDPAWGMLPLGTLGLGLWGEKWELALKPEDVCGHIGVFGPPKSGKSVGFFMHIARAWAPLGALVCLDLKGELRKFTAHYYRETFVLDLINPLNSDRIPVLRECTDAEFAYELASLIVGGDAEKRSDENGQFFVKSSVNLLKLLLIHLATVSPHSGLDEVSNFLSAQSVPDSKGVPLLVTTLRESTSEIVRRECGELVGLDPKTRSNIFVSLGARLKPFTTLASKCLFTPPDPERDGNVRAVPLEALRKRRHAVYVSVTEGDADRFSVILTTIFGVIAAHLRRTTHDPEASVCLFLLDEAGNVPLRGLSRDVNAGRGRRMAYALGYQNLNQVHDIYGRDGGDAILDSLAVKIFLPGCSGNTADWAARLCGKTTVYSRSDTDAVGRHFDNRRESEAQTDLFSADDVRRMMEYREALAVIRNADPTRFGFYPNATRTDRRETRLIRTPVGATTSLEQGGLNP